MKAHEPVDDLSQPQVTVPVANCGSQVLQPLPLLPAPPDGKLLLRCLKAAVALPQELAC